MSQSTTPPSKPSPPSTTTTATTTATGATLTAAKKRRMPPRRRKHLTPKQKLVKESAQQRFKTEKLVFVWQEKLFSQSTISTATLNSASLYLQPKTYNEVIEERVVQEWCGYPLCSKQPRRSMQRFKISLKQRKVFDQTEIANFCSDDCYYKSKYYNMQLSEEPVWFRDLDTIPHVHVITLEQDFKTAVNEVKGKRQQKSNLEIRQEYVQQLLSNVSKDAKSRFEIIEKTTVEPTKRPTLEDGVYDSIEGYRIEVKKSDGKSPSTMVLRKKKKEELEREKQEKEQKEKEDEKIKKKKEEENKDEELDPEDPDALFETMMMLKDMNMDKEDQPSASTTTTTTTTNIQKEKEQNSVKATKAPKHVRFKEEDDVSKNKVKEVEENGKESIAASSLATTTTTTATLNKKQQVAGEGNKKDTTDSNNTTIQVVKTQQKTPKNNNSHNKKKKNVPELSLFGTIWTMLDHMTTKATRIYLTALQNNQDVDIPTLMENESVLGDDTSYMRGQIFSEKILETYGMIRSQLHLSINMENDMISVMKTFRFSDSSMVALNPAQCYLMTLVFIKALADSSIQENTDWKMQFESCCKTVDQSSDMVDACVRVLKVASV